MHDPMTVVQRFEEASGLRVRNSWDAKQIGAAVAIVRAEMDQPGFLVEQMARNARHARESAERVAAHAAKLEEAVRAVSEKLVVSDEVAA